jgi:hypothetical protein
MPDAILIEVPEQFAEDLVNAGFDEAEPMRGGASEAQAILTLALTSTGFAANVATILIAKDALSDFISRLRSWLNRHTGEKEGSELIIEVTSRSPEVQSHIRIVARRMAAGAPPEVDLQKLTSLLQSMIAPDGARPAPGKAMPPAP